MSFNSKIYSVDWNKWVKWLTPGVLRRPKLAAFLRSMIMPINTVHTSLIYYRTNVLYRLSITPQVCFMERALNDRYDIIQRRIYIQDGAERAPIPLFQKVESKPQSLRRKIEGGPLVLYTKAETAQFSADFIINIPVTVDFNISELTAFVNGYKLTSKTFKVKVI